MVSMRNRLIHDYFGVNEEIVWNTVKGDIPDLKKQIEPFIEIEKNRGGV